MSPPSALWPLEEHTRGKHQVLAEYLKAWFPIVGRRNKKILFIDGFAGPGRYAGGEDGSPLIALNAFKDDSGKRLIQADVVFLFIEAAQDRAEHLRKLVNRLRPALPSKCKVHVINAKFDTSLTEVLDAVEAQRSRLAPALVMIDPFGVSDTPMSVIERILKNQRSEVYVSFMYEAMNRFHSTTEFAPHLDDLFGTGSWRDGAGIEDPKERKDFFYGLYEQQLRTAGAQHVIRFELYSGNRLVYAVFFATKHVRGADKMKEAIWKVVPSGNFEFRAARVPQLQLSLDQPDFRPLQEALQAELGDRRARAEVTHAVRGCVSSGGSSAKRRRFGAGPLEREDDDDGYIQLVPSHAGDPALAYVHEVQKREQERPEESAVRVNDVPLILCGFQPAPEDPEEAAVVDVEALNCWVVRG